MTHVDRKTVQRRRALSFETLDDLVNDIDSLAEQGDVEALANWTPAQIVEHVSLFIDMSVHGRPDIKAPWLARVLGPRIKGRLLRRPFKPGFNLPSSLKPFEPPDDVTWDEAVAHLRQAINEAKEKGMAKPSPVFGEMTEDEWRTLHCRHAELHFSFLRPG